MATYSAIRKHEIHAGHRVYQHQGACQHLHGHSYVIHFHCQADMCDELGMVIDFSVIKSTLCKWLDDNYDHRFLIWEKDPIAPELLKIDSYVTLVPYNPTAENIAAHLVQTVAPALLSHTPITVTKVTVEETSKCRAEYQL